MPSVKKSAPALSGAAQPVSLTFAGVALEMLAHNHHGLLEWIISGLGTLAAHVGSGLFHEKSHAREQAATFLTNEQLSAFTGDVLAALTNDFAGTEAAAEYREPLLALAKKLPKWWQRLCDDGDPVTNPLNGQAFVQTLADSLGKPGAIQPLKKEDLVKILKAAAKDAGESAGTSLPYLAAWIQDHLTSALAHGLTSLHGESDRAFRKTLLRFHAASITGIERVTHDLRDLSEDVRAFLRRYIANTEGLEEILAEFRASLGRIEEKLDDVIDRPATAVGAFDIILNKYRSRLVEAFAAYEDLETAAISAADTGKKKPRPTRIDDIFIAPACGTERIPCRVDEFDELHANGKHPDTALIPLLGQEDHRRTVLLADPGLGKSTLLQWLIVSLAQRPHSVPGAPALTGAIPIPVIVRDVDRKLPDDFTAQPTWEKILTALRAVLPPRSAKTASPLFADFSGPDGESAFHTLLGSDRAWFLVDGMDEIGDPARRRAFRDAVWEGFRQHPKARWLITSRVVGYDAAVVDHDTVILPFPGRLTAKQAADKAAQSLREHWGALYEASTVILGRRPDSADVVWGDNVLMEVARLLYLAPFDDSRQKAYVRGWFQHQTGAADDARAESLIEEAHKHTGIRVISRVPSLLCLMAILKRKGLPLPDGRAELYDRITDAYLKTIDDARGITREGHGTFSDAEARQWLSIVGIHMQQRRAALVAEEAEKKKENPFELADTHAGEVGASRAEMEAWLLPHLRDGCAGDAGAGEKLTLFLQYVAARSGLLQPRGEGWYGFVHLSFMEYFAACYLRGQLDHHTQMLADRMEAQMAGEPFDEAAYLAKSPRGPVPILPADLPPLAARDEWHEVLVFLAELHADSGNASSASVQRETRLLRQLFPALHSTATISVRDTDLKDYSPLLPLPAAALAIKLARDSHLRLPPETCHAWFVRLWDAYLAWRVPLTNWHPWEVDALLLDHPAHEASAVAALREAARGHSSLTSLVMENCLGFTNAAILRDIWPQLRELSLWRCIGLSTVNGLPASLKTLYLNDCTGLSAEAVAQVKKALPNCTISGP